MILSCDSGSSNRGNGTSTDPDGDILSSATSGIRIPNSLQTVPSNNVSKRSKLGSRSDYDNDQLELKVSIHALEGFDIIETVLEAISQTLYYDSRVINQNSYAAMIGWDDERGKTLEKWIVKSKMIIENSQDVNKVWAWIDEENQLVKAQFKIYTAPTSSNIYGEWRMDVGFFDPGGTQTGYFVASSTVNDNGETEVFINSSMQEEGETHSMKGKLYLKNDSGKGIVSYPDWDEETQQVEIKTVRYTYDANHVILKEVSTGNEGVFDRTSYTNVYMDYNVYTASDMNNVKKIKQFGFPLSYNNPVTGRKDYYFYGGWQGRHQLWGPEGSMNLPVGTELISQDHGSNEGASYTIGARYQGYLVEKTLVDASLNEIKGETLETNSNEGFKIMFDGIEWKRCNGADGPWDCSSVEGSAYDISGLRTDEQNRKWVWLWGESINQQVILNIAGDGFQGYTPGVNDTIWVNISMPLYLTWNGSNWQRYSSVSYLQDQWEPVLSNPVLFSFSYDGEFYMHSKGINFILEISSGQTLFALKKELENVIQPGIESDSLSSVTFTSNGNSYSWDSANLMLKDSNNLNVTQSEWYLEGSNGKVYTWQYAQNSGETWNILTYLKDDNGSFVFLDDPIFFNSFTIGSKTITSMGFQGHLFGLPDVWRMLEENNWTLSQDMKDKIVNIPAGTEVTGKDGISYVIKPVFGVQLLDPVVSGYSVAIDESITLDNLPQYNDPGIGSLPVVDSIIVVEGVFVAE